MKFIQTIWTGQRSLLVEPFGWAHPEFHLMSWALSCLSLKRYYDSLTLYTDSEGCYTLIDKLKLPYDNVIVQKDNLPCLPQNWAYSKIKTYSLQCEPFLHIDSDFYLKQSFPDKLLTSKLIAQNKEHGTSYYKGMIDVLFNFNSIKIPDYLKMELKNEAVPSFNMGIFGGDDLNFIHHYCNEVFKFFNENHLNDINNPNSTISCNVVFEQIFFAIIAKKARRHVETLFKQNMQDNGYTVEDFCNLSYYKNKSFFHIIGGHKKNKLVCESLGKALLEMNPEYYENIIRLFPKQHRRLTYSFHILNNPPDLPTYHDFISQQEISWKELTPDYLLKQEKKAAHYTYFLNADKQTQLQTIFSRHPLLSIYSISPNCSQEIRQLLVKRFPHFSPKNFSDIALIPALTENGLIEAAIDDAAYNILAILNAPKTFGEIQKEFTNTFSVKLKIQSKKINECLRRTISYLLFYGIITI